MFPTAIFPSMVGRPLLRSEEKIGDIEIKDIMVGDEASAARQNLEIKYPMENGIIKYWDDMEHLWKYTFDEKLHINPSECKILLTEPPRNPAKNKEKIGEIMFEKFGFQGVYIAVQAVLVLYAQGVLTGVVVDSGDGVTHIIPVYEGFDIPNLVRSLDIAGSHVTQRMIDLLLLRGYAFNRTADFETIRMLKEKFCYVGYDLNIENQLGNETTVLMESYQLPDGRNIKLGPERYLAPEILFKPSLIGKESMGIHEMLFDCINSADLDLRADFYSHILLSGGTSMLPGLPSRLKKELQTLYDLNADETLKKGYQSVTSRATTGGASKKKASVNISIEDPPKRKHLVFQGGAVLAKVIEDQPNTWITKRDYEEKGKQVMSQLRKK